MTKRLTQTRAVAAFAFALLALLLMAPGAAQAAAPEPIKRSLCIYDPLGTNGPVFQAFQSNIIRAREWGIAFDAIPYTEEAVAAADFKSGQCDAVAITGLRAKQFVNFAGSLDMVGGLQTYDQFRLAVRVMSSPRAAEYMSQDGYEVIGVVPLGKVYLFARQTEWLASLDAAAGHKIAVMSYDKQAVTLAKIAGVSPVPATIATFGTMFNNGAVDLAYAPAVAFEALELYKGLGENGGIADFVLGMLSGQMLIHKNRFPEGFGQKSRTWAFKNLFDRVLRRVKQADADIPDKYWVHIADDRAKNYRQMIREVRQQLWEANWYSHKMQSLLKKIRCKTHPGLAECSMATEGGPVR